MALRWNLSRAPAVDHRQRTLTMAVGDFGKCVVMADHLRFEGKAEFVLRLYVTGTTVRSTRAITNLRQLCDQYLPDRYDLEVVDIYQQPELAAREQLVAIPTLVKRQPLPLRRLVGDLSNRQRVLAGLDCDLNLRNT